MTRKFIHITDTHFVPAPQRLYGLDPRARLRAAVADINAHHADAECVVITGDLTHLGEPQAFRDLHQVLAELKVPYHLVLGNHDLRDNFRAVFGDTPVDDNGFVQYSFALADGVGLVIDTLIEGSDAGHLCERRLAWLEARLGELRGRPVYLFLHHAPCDIGVPSMDDLRLLRSEGLARLLKAHGGIRHIFFGHVHRPIAGSWHGIPLSTLPATNHQVMLQFKVAQLTPGTLEQPAYGVVRVEDDSVIVHFHSYLDDSPRYMMDDLAAAQAQSPAELPSLDPKYF